MRIAAELRLAECDSVYPRRVGRVTSVLIAIGALIAGCSQCHRLGLACPPQFEVRVVGALAEGSYHVVASAGMEHLDCTLEVALEGTTRVVSYEPGSTLALMPAPGSLTVIDYFRDPRATVLVYAIDDGTDLLHAGEVPLQRLLRRCDCWEVTYGEAAL